MALDFIVSIIYTRLNNCTLLSSQDLLVSSYNGPCLKARAKAPRQAVCRIWISDFGFKEGAVAKPSLNRFDPKSKIEKGG